MLRCTSSCLGGLLVTKWMFGDRQGLGRPMPSRTVCLPRPAPSKSTGQPLGIQNESSVASVICYKSALLASSSLPCSYFAASTKPCHAKQNYCTWSKPPDAEYLTRCDTEFRRPIMPTKSLAMAS